MNSKHVNLYAPLNPTGFGTHGQYLSSELISLTKKRDFTLCVCPTGVVLPSINEEIRNKITNFFLDTKAKTHRRENGNVHIVLDVPKNCLEWNFRSGKFAKGKKIAYTVFELEPKTNTNIFDVYFKQLNDLGKQFDEVWVPSLWAKQILIKAGVNFRKVFVVHEGIGNFNFDSKARNSDEFTGISFGTIGKFEKRKGHHDLIKSLSSLTHLGFRFNAWWDNPWDDAGYVPLLYENGWKEEEDIWVKDKSVIKVYPSERYQRNLMTDVAFDCDAMLFPSYAEGWGLPIGDCIGMGIPTYACNSTGVKEYFDTYLDLLADEGVSAKHNLDQVSELKSAYDGLFFWEQGEWRPVDQFALTQMIKSIILRFNDRGFNKDAYIKVGKKMKEYFSWQRSALQVLNLLEI